MAAAIALSRNTDLPAAEIAKKSMEIAGDICVFTNHNITMLEL
jgi:ATP-dependent HslUV protease subunit HslV